MIPAAAPFFDPLQNNAPKKEVLIAQLLQKMPMETNVYSKAKFYRWHKQNNGKKIPIFYYLRFCYYFFCEECFKNL
jgi:hypothetical protein